VYESAEDVVALQELLDRTFARMNPHMANILKPERRLSARQVVAYLQGIKHVAFATVNERGQPRVAPLDGIFLRGRFHVSTGGQAARLKDLRRQPRCSLTHFVGDDVAVTVNGAAVVMDRNHPEMPAIEPVYLELYESSPFSWGEGVVIIRVEPSSMWSYSFTPERYAEPDADPVPV
jgi:uncharacterized pyridoxamine 5'-phosphate oxidase family protein